MSDFEKRMSATRTQLETDASFEKGFDISGSAELFLNELKQNAQNVSDILLKYKITIQSLLLIVFTALAASSALAQTKDSFKDEISTLIELYEKEKESEGIRQNKDAIDELLTRYNQIGVHEFKAKYLEKRTLRADVPFEKQEGFEDMVTCLTHNVFREAGGEPLVGQQMVLYITIARTLSGRAYFGGGSLCDAVRMKNQFSWIFDKRILAQYPTEKQESQFLQLKRYIKDLLSKKTPMDFVNEFNQKYNLNNGTFFYCRKDMWGVGSDGKVFGIKPKDPKKAERLKMSPGVADMFLRLNEVATFGNHAVYSETPPVAK